MARRGSMVLAAAVCMLAVTACTGRAVKPDSISSMNTSATAQADESRTAAFDQAAWNSTAQGQGRTVAAARIIEREGLLLGMSLEQVGKLLGTWDASAIPADYGLYPGGAAGVVYELVEGPSLKVDFEGGTVRSVTILEPAGPPEESVKLAGTWRVVDNAPLERLKLTPSGGLVRGVRRGDRRRPRYGRWAVVAPGRIICWRPYLNSDTRRDSAALYEYRISDDQMTLTWVDAKVDVPGGPAYRGPYEWEPWVGANSAKSIVLRRQE